MANFFFFLSFLLLVLVFNSRLNVSIQVSLSKIPSSDSTDTCLLMSIYSINSLPDSSPPISDIVKEMFTEASYSITSYSGIYRFEFSWSTISSLKIDYKQTYNFSLNYILNNITSTLLSTKYNYTNLTIGFYEDVILGCSFTSVCGKWNETISLSYYTINTLNNNNNINISSYTYSMGLYVYGDNSLCDTVNYENITKTIQDTLFPKRDSSQGGYGCTRYSSTSYYQWEREMIYNSIDNYLYDAEYYNNFYNINYMQDNIKYNLEKNYSSLTYLNVYIYNYINFYCNNNNDNCFVGLLSSNGYNYSGITNFNFTTTTPAPTTSPTTGSTTKSPSTQTSNSISYNIKYYHSILLFLSIIIFIY